jgi:hypothetical protein
MVINDAFCSFSSFRDGKLEPVLQVPRTLSGGTTTTATVK